MHSGTYIGDELALFAHAHRWKAYWQARITPYVRGRVLEVGGGVGANTPFFAAYASELTVLEPDIMQAAEIEKLTSTLPPPLRGRTGFVRGALLRVTKPWWGVFCSRLLPPTSFLHTRNRSLEKASLTLKGGGGTGDVKPRVLAKTIHEIDGEFDAIFYIDVLEHIENDRAEIDAALSKLAAGGVLVVLAPAHQTLYSPFDKAIGHFRRYTAKSLAALAPERASTSFYLDVVGCAASFANKRLLKQSLPTLSQIKLWDGVMVPLSRLLDPLCFYTLGKTVVVVFKKSGHTHV